jgi:uncharacterized protein (UPF0371 family)
MGVNMAGCAIVDDEACFGAFKQESIRRFYEAQCSLRKGNGDVNQVHKLEMMMNSLGLTTADRRTVPAALTAAELTGGPATAIELPDGTVVTGKTSDLLGASSAALLNALKRLANIDDRIELISPAVLEPIQDLKVNHLGNKNPRLHTDEVLIALSICAVTNPTAELAMQQIGNLAGCQVHTSVILSSVDESVFKKLGTNLTSEPVYQTSRLYHK